MLKPLALAMLLASAQPVLAETWSYDFSGTLSDHFYHLWSTPTLSEASQTGGQLVFHTLVAAPPETSQLFLFTDASPSYQQSWIAHLDVSVPQSLNLQSPYSTENAWAAASLLAITTDGYGNPKKGMSIDLEANADTHTSSYWAGAYDFATDTDIADNIRTTTDSSGTLWLSFDAATKVLTATDPTGTLLNVDTGSWGMTGTDVFHIGISFDTHGMEVPDSQAMSMDNFSLTIQPVPEPETYALMLAGLGLVGWVVQRRKSA